MKNKPLRGKIADECENTGDTGESRALKKKRDSKLPHFYLLSIVTESLAAVKWKKGGENGGPINAAGLLIQFLGEFGGAAEGVVRSGE